MVMRAIVALVLVGCAVELPADLDGSAAECRPDPGAPSCNGDRRRDECAELGLPSAYGFDSGCMHPVRPVGAECPRRRQGLYRCVQSGDLTCCYE